MTKGAAKGKRISEENTARRLALQEERRQLIKQDLLPKNRIILGAGKNPRIRIDKFQEEGTIKINRARWREEHSGEVPPWGKFSMG